jgi:Tat protein translocase TatB subunit
MFGMGMPELLLILVVALVVVGPRKLPDIAKNLGKGLRQFREAADEIKEGLRENEAYQDFSEAKKSFKETMDTVNPKSYFQADDLSLAPKKPKVDLAGRKALYKQIEAEYQENATGQEDSAPGAANDGTTSESEAQSESNGQPAAQATPAAPEETAKKDA